MEDYDKGKKFGLELAQYGIYGAIEGNIFYYRITNSELEKAKTKAAIKALCLVRNQLAIKLRNYEN